MSAENNHEDNSASTSGNGVARVYLKLADEAVRRGELPQSAHLYLAAFDAAQAHGTPDADYVDGLRKAWKTAVDLRDTSLAEHVYGLLEPYSTEQDAEKHNEHLKDLASSALEGFGLSSDEASGLADMLLEASREEGGATIAVTSVLSPEREIEEAPRKKAGAQKGEEEQMGYAQLVGYDRAIDEMHKRGIGLEGNEAYEEFLSMLRRRHGIHDASHAQTVLIGSDNADDANVLMIATGVEAGVPAVRMRVDESPIGFPTLSIMMSKDIKSGQRLLQTGFEGPGVLMLENLDLWEVPSFTDAEGAPLPLYMQMTRGAMQAIAFIRNAVEDPQVLVLASSGSRDEVDDYFIDLLAPVDYFELDRPNREERGALWNYACTMHPSLRMLDREELVECTRGMARTEIFSAAHQAVEVAWRKGVRERRYIPVTRANVMEKIASYLPVDTDEYHKVEDMLVWSMDDEMDALERQIDRWRQEADDGQTL